MINKQQERQVRGISRFLRAIYEGDIPACATIVTAEAEILAGRDIDKNIDTMIKALDVVRECCSDGIAKLKLIKGE